MKLLAWFQANAAALNGYDAAKLTRMPPLKASRALEMLATEGLVEKADSVDGTTDPAAAFRSRQVKLTSQKQRRPDRVVPVSATRMNRA